MTKNEIRLSLKEQRDKLTSAERDKLGKELRDRLYQTEAYQHCKMIFPYLSFRSEVDTKEIIQKSIKNGKSVFLPRVEDKDMNFYQILDLERLIVSKFGVSEPSKEEKSRYLKSQDYMDQKHDIVHDAVHDKKKSVDSSEHINLYQNLMLLPGLAFDLTGNRIGYGAGYYDRYLSGFPLTHFYKIGLAYDFQVIENIPADEFDIKADAILTPSGLITCHYSYI